MPVEKTPFEVEVMDEKNLLLGSELAGTNRRDNGIERKFYSRSRDRETAYYTPSGYPLQSVKSPKVVLGPSSILPSFVVRHLKDQE